MGTELLNKITSGGITNPDFGLEDPSLDMPLARHDAIQKAKARNKAAARQRRRDEAVADRARDRSLRRRNRALVGVGSAVTVALLYASGGLGDPKPVQSPDVTSSVPARSPSAIVPPQSR